MNELPTPGRPTPELPQLERRYRRRLAFYPRAFRRENEDEILAVLLACAEDGQQRPGLAATADLLRGALRMRLRPPGSPPRTVRAAIRLMFAGAAAQVATLITIIVTAGSVRAAVAHSYPGLAAAQHALNVSLTMDYYGAGVGIVVWLWLTRQLIRGRNRARIAVALDFGVASLSLAISLSDGTPTWAPADLIVGIVFWLIALATTVLLLTGASSRYYQPTPRPATPWRGTFGTM
jgi:hypothetical protein